MTNEYNLSFIGEDEELDKEAIFDIYDINYINLKNLPIVYYPIYNNNLNETYIEENIKNNTNGKTTTDSKIVKEYRDLFNIIDNDKKIYNYYLITPISILISIVWIIFLLFILKYIHYNYHIYYIYIIIFIIICLLIFGSLWFIYVNNQLL
jgi:hypothetical protein